MKDRAKAVGMLVTAMLIFGSIGLFVRYISFPSSIVAFVRAFIGVIFLICVMLLKGTKVSLASIKQNLLILVLSGAAIGFNWILLFESYRYTSIAVSTLCYYVAPIIVTIFAPIVLKEKLSIKRIACAFVALIGVGLISGLLSSNVLKQGEERGIILGLGAASLYASAILLNKRLHNITAMDRTIFQLLVAAIVLIPYNLITCDFGDLVAQPLTFILILFVGIVHTGLAYYLYFGAMEHLSGQSIAITSYIDPLVAVMISVLLLKEYCDVYTVIGGIAILGAAVISELPNKGRRKNDH